MEFVKFLVPLRVGAIDIGSHSVNENFTLEKILVFVTNYILCTLSNDKEIEEILKFENLN